MWKSIIIKYESRINTFQWRSSDEDYSEGLVDTNAVKPAQEICKFLRSFGFVPPEVI